MPRVLLATLLLSLLAIPAGVSPNSWTEPPLSASPPARYGHSMVNLNGQIHVFGGQGETPLTFLDDLWKFDEEQALWEEQPRSGYAPSARRGHAAVVYNGKMYVLFGQDSQGYLNDVWQYDPRTASWALKTAAAPISPRARHAVATASGLVWITGGETDQGDSSEVWTYHPGLNTWHREQDLPAAMSGHTAVNYQGEVYIYGSSGVLKLGGTRNAWASQNRAPATLQIKGHVAAVDFERGVMIVCGGERPATEVAVGECYEYWFESQYWFYLGLMPYELNQSAGAWVHSSFARVSPSLARGRLVMFGGLSSAGAPTDCTLLYTRTYPIYLPLGFNAYPPP